MVQPNGARLASPSKPCQQWQRKEVQAKLDSIYTQAHPPGNNNNNNNNQLTNQHSDNNLLKFFPFWDQLPQKKRLTANVFHMGIFADLEWNPRLQYKATQKESTLCLLIFRQRLREGT